MGIVNNSMMARASGTFDNVVFVTRNGQTYFRSKPKKYHDAKSPKQLKCRKAITISNKPLVDLAKYACFKYTREGQTQRNALMKRIMKKARVYQDDKWIILPEKISLSNGSLDAVINLAATTTEKHNIQITWSNDPYSTTSHPTDNMYIIFYNPLSRKDKIVEASQAAVTRESACFSYPTPPRWAGKTIYIYIYTVSKDSSNISDTRCLKIIAS